MTAPRVTELPSGFCVNFEHVTIDQLVVSTNNATGTTIDTPNEPFTKIGMNATRQCLGLKSGRDNKGIWQHATIAVDPMRFILHGVNDDVVETVEQHVVHQSSHARSIEGCKSFLHVVESFF